MNENLGKGEEAEEYLRTYFLGLGYYVIRSIDFVYKGFDVTDIDLFLYNKVSPFSRERIIVDIKNKKTPQAIERIFWTRGLQDVLNMDKAIVATTDTRQEITDFGKQNDIYVLDGNLQSRLRDGYIAKPKTRITEEQFNILMVKDCVGDLYGNWKNKNDEIKSLFIKEIDFNTCNRILDMIKEALEYFVSAGKNESSSRILYLFISYFLIALDFSMKDLSFFEEEKRKQCLDNFFKYGQTGYERTKEIIETIKNILSSAGSKMPRQTIQDAVETNIASIKSDILAEYFNKSVIFSHLFDSAKCFENYAYLINVPQIENIRSEDKSIIAVLCDFSNLDRKEVL